MPRGVTLRSVCCGGRLHWPIYRATCVATKLRDNLQETLSSVTSPYIAEIQPFHQLTVPPEWRRHGMASSAAKKTSNCQDPLSVCCFVLSLFSGRTVFSFLSGDKVFRDPFVEGNLG